RRAHTDENTHGKACQSAVEHISSQPVRAERILKAGSQIFSGKIRHHRRVSAENARRSHSRQKNHGDNQKESGTLAHIFSFSRCFHAPFPPLRILGSTVP